MTTGRDIITASLRSIKVLGADEAAEGSVASNALSALNQMIDVWSADGNAIFSEAKLTHTLTPSDGDYTIGKAGGEDIDEIRPTDIKAAFINDGNRDYYLKLVGEQKFSRIARKTQSTVIPCYLYYDANFPTATLRLWPVPSTADTLNLWCRQPLTALTLSGTLSLPPGYEEALIYNLGCRLAPWFNKELSLDYKEIAQNGYEIIERANKNNDLEEAELDEALTGGQEGSFDIYSGY